MYVPLSYYFTLSNLRNVAFSEPVVIVNDHNVQSEKIRMAGKNSGDIRISQIIA